MGTSSGANIRQQSPTVMLPPRRHHHHQHRPTSLQAALSLVSPDPQAMASGAREPGANSEQGHDSQTESASSRETWPVESNRPGATAAKTVEKEGENEHTELQVARRLSTADKLLLREVAREGVDVISDRMAVMADGLLEELKSDLRVILEGTGGSQHREELLHLQQLVQGRSDLDMESLARAHKAQLEILVAINTGIQAFLHPNVSLPQNRLFEIFAYKRCRNIACQSPLPADDCNCEICSTKNGFCNLCMCVACSKFDFEVNTCRWIGCDLCSHWTHTDCAIRVKKIGMGPSSKSGVSASEMLFRCQACERTSELLGWVKDVFQHCSLGWDREALSRELHIVRKIFQCSDDAKGRKLYWKCDELLEKLKSGFSESSACRMILLFFQELEMESTKNPEGEEAGRLLAPHDACNRIAEVVQETLRKMEVVAEEKMRMCKRGRLALEACERELDDKAREVAELKEERQRKKQQVEELESIVRLKQAEAEMFRFKASEARREAERLQTIALAKTEKAEQEYASRYLKARLEEAEMERRCLFERMKLQEGPRHPEGSGSGAADRHPADPSASKIQDLLRNVHALPSGAEGQQQNDHQSPSSAHQ